MAIKFGARTFTLVTVGGVAAVDHVIAMIHIDHIAAIIGIDLDAHALLFILIGSITAIHHIVAMIDIHLGTHTLITIAIFSITTIQHIAGHGRTGNRESQNRNQSQHFLARHMLPSSLFIFTASSFFKTAHL
jgi:hypothetical protein